MIDRLPRVEMVIVSAGGFFPYDWSGQPSESDWTTYQDRKDVHRTVFRALLLSAINDSALKKYISPSWEIYHINLSIIVLSVDINTKVIATEWSGVLWELTNVSLSDVIRIRYLYMSIKTNWQEWKIVLTNIENWWPRMSPKHWSNIEIQGFWKRISVLDPTDVTRPDWRSGQVFLYTNPMANADQLCGHFEMEIIKCLALPGCPCLVIWYKRIWSWQTTGFELFWRAWWLRLYNGLTRVYQDPEIILIMAAWSSLVQGFQR